MDGYYVGRKDDCVALSGDLSGLPKIIYSPGFSGCHLALFSWEEKGAKFYVGAHIYKGGAHDVPQAVVDHEHPKLKLVARWSRTGLCKDPVKAVNSLLWVTGDDATAYWVKYTGPGPLGSAKATVEEAKPV